MIGSVTKGIRGIQKEKHITQTDQAHKHADKTYDKCNGGIQSSYGTTTTKKA